MFGTFLSQVDEWYGMIWFKRVSIIVYNKNLIMKKTVFPCHYLLNVSEVFTVIVMVLIFRQSGKSEIP